MKKIQTEGHSTRHKLNRYRHEYYNLAALSVSDVVYDHLFVELQELEKRTASSPTIVPHIREFYLK